MTEIKTVQSLPHPGSYNTLAETLPQQKPVVKWVVRVDHEFVTPREVGVAFDFRNNCRVAAQLRLFHDFSSEPRVQNAFKPEGLSHPQVSFGVEERQVCADPGSGW